MPERYASGYRFTVVGCLIVFLVLFEAGLLRTSFANPLPDIEMQAHEKLALLMKDRNKLSTFTTDGCSGGLSDTWRTISDWFPIFAKAHRKAPPWETCCVLHDRAYHAAGGATEANESYALRLAADEALRRCVYDTRFVRSSDLQAQYGLTEHQVRSAYRIIADTMFRAVRIGGFPCTGLEWRWGYGYPHCPSTLAGNE
jgi:hypothetical protein